LERGLDERASGPAEARAPLEYSHRALDTRYAGYGRRKRHRRRIDRRSQARYVEFAPHSIDTLGVRMEPVVGELVLNIERDQQARGEADREAEQVDREVGRAAHHMTLCRDEVVDQHGVSRPERRLRFRGSVRLSILIPRTPPSDSVRKSLLQSARARGCCIAKATH